MKYLLFYCITLISINVYASPTCSENGTKVLYTNGVNTRSSEAHDALSAIIELEVSSEIDAKKVGYEVKYNYHGDGARNFFESAVQRFPQQYLNSLKIDKWKALILFLSGKLDVPGFVSESIQREFLERTKEFIENRTDIPTYYKNVTEISNAYNDALNGTGYPGKCEFLPFLTLRVGYL